jgi:anti-sigma factor RsiW
MKNNCIDENVLHSYLDGELSPAALATVRTHLASCKECAVNLRRAEDEIAFFTTAFGDDPLINVPTERLRARLDTSIAEVNRPIVTKDGFGSRLLTWIGAIGTLISVRPQLAFGYASVAIIVLCGAIFAGVYFKNQPSKNYEQRPALMAAGGTPTQPSVVVNPSESPLPVSTPDRGNSQRAQGPPHKPRTRSIPGEKSYLNAIASLESAIHARGDSAMQPALRVEYEKNRQLIDQAISQTRGAAIRQRGDSNATEFLFAAYQSKVELLTAVADRAQLVAVAR